MQRKEKGGGGSIFQPPVISVALETWKKKTTQTNQQTRITTDLAASQAPV